MTEPKRQGPGTQIAERLVFFGLAMGGVFLFTLLPTEGTCGEAGCATHLYDYEISWWILLIPLAATEALLRYWQIKAPDTSKRAVTQRIGIRVLVACIAFGAGYLARSDRHGPSQGEASSVEAESGDETSAPSDTSEVTP